MAPKPKKAKNGTIEDVENRILVKLAERLAFEITEVSKIEIVKAAGYSFPTAARFIAATKSLKAKDLVKYNTGSKSYSITEKGLAHLPESSRPVPQEQPKTNQEFHNLLKEQLKSPKGYELLLKLADGGWHKRVQVCNDIGYKFPTAQAFSKSVVELKTLGFLEAGQGLVRLTDKAFPCGRPE